MIFMNNTLLREQRCECGKLLLKGIFFQASLEIKCKKCGKINKIGEIKNLDNENRYLLVFNEKGIISNADDAAYHILGYDPGELLGKHFTEIDTSISKETQEKLMSPEGLLDEDHYFQIDSYNKTKSGQMLPVNVLLKLCMPTQNERYVLAVVALRDDNKIKLADKNYNQFSDNACDFYFDIDKQGIAKYISSSVETLFGISPELGLGRSYLDFLPEDRREESKKRFDYFVARGEGYRILDHVGLDGDGVVTKTDLFFTPNRNHDGEFVGYRVLGWLKNK